uniref:TASOR PIN domain-containing protein n=1 Tax=Romanomermis culicivorax TaxID=13658 RepID=A0A915I4X1_ROMCU
MFYPERKRQVSLKHCFLCLIQAASTSDSQLIDSSAPATPERNVTELFIKPPPIIPLVEVEDNDVIVDRLIIQESTITPPASSTKSSVLSEQYNKSSSSNVYKTSSTAKNIREIDDCIFIETTSKRNPASLDGAEDEGTGLTGRGILIPDDLIFVNTPAEDAELILNEFDQRFRTGEADWTMKVHSQMVLRLAEVKKNLDAKSDVYERVTKLLILLTRFRSMGRVELLSRHDCDIASKASRDYLGCACRIKRESGNLECVFLSMLSAGDIQVRNLNPSSSAANEFFSAGIKVMNIAAFKKSHLKIKSKRS